MTAPIHPAKSNVRLIRPIDLRVEQLRFEVSPSFGFRDFVILVSGGLSAVAMGLLILWWQP